jgi:hypothetical protein
MSRQRDVFDPRGPRPRQHFVLVPHLDDEFDDEGPSPSLPRRARRSERDTSIAEQMHTANELIRDLARHRDASQEEIRIKRLVAAVLDLLESSQQLPEAHDEDRHQSLVSRAQQMFHQAVQVRERERLDAGISQLVGVLSTEYIKAVLWSVLDNGMHNHVKFILLLCCMRLPRGRARNGLYSSCLDLDVSEVSMKHVSFWLAF